MLMVQVARWKEGIQESYLAYVFLLHTHALVGEYEFD
jgi:hypothetical protein